MALLKCYECGRDVSDRATACPHCGAPAEPKAASAPKPITDFDCENEYLLKDGDNRTGPYTLDQMRAMYLASEINDKTLCSTSRAGAWLPVEIIFNEMFSTARKSDANAFSTHAASVAQMATPTSRNTSRTASPPIKVCNECQGEIPAQATRCQHCGTKIKGTKITPLEFLGATLAVIIVAFFFMDSPRHEDDDAYRAAETFIKREFPGARSVSPQRESRISWESGGRFLVEVTVDGLNAFGGPVRNVITVELRHNGDNWDLVNIHREGGRE